MRFSPTLSCAVAAILLAPLASAAAGAPANRVDFLESPAVIGLGQWQFDPAFPALRRGAALDTPQRVSQFQALRPSGAASASMELHASAIETSEPPAVESPLDRMRRQHGFSDVSFGARWRVRGGDAGWLPGVAWLADVEATMGSPAFRGRDFRPSLRATAEWELPRHLTLGVMPGVYRDRGDGGHHYAAAVLAITLGKAWTPRLQSFIELAGQRMSRRQADGSLLDVDTGVAFIASRSLQVDMVVSRSLAGNASQALRGGLSVSSRF